MTRILTKKNAPKSLNPPTNGMSAFHRFTLEQYHRMIDTGILTPSHKVELLEGWIVNKMPQNPPHRTAVSRLNRWMGKSLPEEQWYLAIQAPITLADSEPEPDLVIARGPDSRYEKRHPGPGDVVLVIEVGDSSALEDRRLKIPLYAGAKIPEVWLINLQSRRAEVYTTPQSGPSPFYRNIVEIASNEVLTLVLDGKRYGEMKVKTILS
jgi:Uma2 family endonuclease